MSSYLPPTQNAGIFDTNLFKATTRKAFNTPNTAKYINNLSDFPTPINNVIYLEDLYTYIITGTIDLGGSRLETTGVCNLFGYSSETSFLTSTGLGAGIPLLTSQYTTVIESISFQNVDTCIYIDGTLRTVALDWKAVNFINIPNVGTINTCDNFIFETGSFLGSKGLTFTGTVGTIGIVNSLFRGDGLTGNIFNVSSTAVITRRFRMIYSSIVAFGSTVGINFDVAATVPNESYILDTVNFSGGSTYLTGVTTSSNKALFKSCVGIVNTAVNGLLYTSSNATATIISNTTDYYKILGTTIAGSNNEKYTATNNRLTNEATIIRKYLVQATLSFTAGNGNVCEFAFYDSKIATIRASSLVKSTANASGRAENINLQDIVIHSIGDYIEIWVRNTSASVNVTVEQINLIITEII